MTLQADGKEIKKRGGRTYREIDARRGLVWILT